MKSRRIRSVLKFADNVDVIDDDYGNNDSRNGKKRKVNKKVNKKTAKTKKTRRSKREVVGDKSPDSVAVEDKDKDKDKDVVLGTTNKQKGYYFFTGVVQKTTAGIEMKNG